MAKRTLFALMVATGALAVAPMAHAGKETVTITTSVVSPAVSVATNNSLGSTMAAILRSVRSGTVNTTVNADGSRTFTPASGGGSITLNTDRSITVITAGGRSVTYFSSFIGGMLAAYL
jgi:hypothetical protein